MDSKKDANYFNRICSITYAIILLVMTVLCIGFLLIITKYSEHTETEIIPIYSISTDDEYSGKFVLGSGGINKTEYIVAYRLTEDGGKVYYKLPRQKVIIYDTLAEGEQPYVEIITTGYTSETKLYIPQNTVEKEINLDL